MASRHISVRPFLFSHASWSLHRPFISTRFPLLSLADDGGVDRTMAACLLRMLERVPLGSKRYNWSREAVDILLLPGVHMYAREYGEDGATKRDDKLGWFRVRPVHVEWGRYRYSAGVDVVGQRCMNGVRLDRLFVEVDEASYDAWKSFREGELKKDADFYDDGGACLQLMRCAHLFDASDQERRMVPMFGFLDSGAVIARSCQSVVLNPFVRMSNK